MTRLTVLFIAAALVLPGAAFAVPADRDPGNRAANTVLDKNGIDQAAAQRKAEAVGRYYASFGDEQSLPAPAPAATDDNGLSWSIAIGAGFVLILLAGGLGVYAGRMVRPRHIGA